MVTKSVVYFSGFLDGFFLMEAKQHWKYLKTTLGNRKNYVINLVCFSQQARSVSLVLYFGLFGSFRKSASKLVSHKVLKSGG